MIPPTPPEAQGISPTPEELAMGRFKTRLAGGRPLATYTLLAALGAIFVMETSLGGSDSGPTLAHMGANVVAFTRGGEIERLLAASTLHAGPGHALMNLYVLFALGRTMEALVGRARFLVLYVAAALGGGLGTTLLSSAEVSVGASGAMWGLLGAMGMLAFRPAGLVPAPAIPGWRRMALTNLGLNLFVSFIPGIDVWAHLGGGIVGALLVGSGLLTVGLSLDEPPSKSRHTALFAVAAGVLCLVLCLSVGVAWARGRPWDLVRDPSYTRRFVPEARLVVEAPALLTRDIVTEPTPYGTSYSLGEMAFDPYAIVLLPTPRIVPLTDGAVLTQLLELERAEFDAFDPADGSAPIGPTTTTSLGGSPALVRSWRYPNGLLYHRLIVAAPSHDVLIEVVAWEVYDGSLEVAEHVAASIGSP